MTKDEPGKVRVWWSELRFFVTGKKLSEIVEEQVERASIELENWKLAEFEGRDKNNGEDYVSFAESIFDKYPEGINEVSLGVYKKDDDSSEKTTLTESDFTSSGLSHNQDPLVQQTIEKLRLQQRTSNWQWNNFPIAKSIIENIKRYVFGRGVKIDCPIPEVKAIIDNFWLHNKMELRIKNMFREWLLDGEVFPLFFDNAEKDPDFDVKIDPVLVMRSVNSAEISEIEYDLDDAETRLSYLREKFTIGQLGGKIQTKKVRYKDTTHPFLGSDIKGLPKQSFNNSVTQHVSETGVEIKTERMMMFKIGRSTDDRGRPIMEAVHRWNRVYLDFAYDRAMLNHLRSKIFLVETRSGKSGRTTDSSTISQRFPKAGIMLVETPDRKFRVMAPETGAGDAETDIKILLYMIGSNFSMPIHILNMNAENENYASIKEAGNPFAQYIQDMQDDWTEYIKQIIRYLIFQAVRNNVLDTEYEVEFYPADSVGEVTNYLSNNLTESNYEDVLFAAKDMLGEKETKMVNVFQVPLSITFPSVVQVDEQKQATALKIKMELGLISKYTARLSIGVDPETEEGRIASEMEADLERQQQAFDKFNTGAGFGDGGDDEAEETSESIQGYDDENSDELFFETVDEMKEDIAARGGIEEGGDPARFVTYRANNKTKVLARREVRKALRNGKLTKPSACTCGSKSKLSFHHIDYRKPLSGSFKCFKCHSKLDNKKEGVGK